MKPSMLDHALELARRGHEVFPLHGKVPAISGGHGCWDASHDPQVVRRLWACQPEANIGIHVAADELVVDVDPRHGGDLNLAVLEARHDVHPPTRTALTGRGDGGHHLTFVHPGGSITATGLPKGIDLKQRGGYVVAPPSVHPDTGQPYRWLDSRPPVALPPWFVAIIRPLTAPARCTPVYSALPGLQLEGLVRFVMASAEGERNNRLYWAACRGSELVQAGLYGELVIRAVFQGAGEDVGLPPDEVLGTVGSAFKPDRRP